MNVRTLTPVLDLALAGVVAFSLVGCGRHGAEASAGPAARPVIAETVAAAERGTTEHYSGEVHARYETALSFRVDGKITERKGAIGERVKAGQVLARLDPSDATMNAASARAAVSAAVSQQNVARLQRDRIAALRGRSLVSQSQLDQAEDALKAADAALQQARQQLGVRENQVRYATLVADHDGIITTQDAEAGQVVAAGQPVFGLAWSDQREVYISVPEGRVAALRDGAAFDISLWAKPGRHYKGELRELSAAADPQSRTFLAKIAIVEADADIGLRTTADVAVTSANDAGTFILPASALFHDGPKPAVWVIDEHSKLVLREVDVARYVDAGVAISRGLAAGERVVTRGVHTLHAGDLVRVVELPFQTTDASQP